MCGRPDTEHPWQPRRGGGMERGPCPATQQSTNIGAATPAAPGADATSDGDYMRLAVQAGAVVPPGYTPAPPVFPSWGAWGRFCDSIRAALAQPAPVQQIGAEAIPSPSAAERGLTDAERRLLQFLFANMTDLSDKDWRDHGFRLTTFDSLDRKMEGMYTRSGKGHLATPMQQDAPAPSMVGDAVLVRSVPTPEMLRAFDSNYDGLDDEGAAKNWARLIALAAISGQKPAEGEKG